MAQTEIKAPLFLWAICVALVFLGFHQLSSGLKVLLDTVEPQPLIIAKIAVGICFVISGIALSFLTTFGKVMILAEAIAGIILSLAHLNWVRFMFDTDQFSRSSGVPFCDAAWSVVICGCIFTYLMFSPTVTRAFKAQNHRGLSGLKKKKYL